MLIRVILEKVQKKEKKKKPIKKYLPFIKRGRQSRNWENII